jgi:Terminase RNaseH-like domain
MNWAQKILWEERHNCEIVLKARQLGITTFFCILNLDNVLWRDNKQAGILAHTFKDASDIFKDKLKFAFDCLHPNLRRLFKTVGDSATELSFTHGSSIRVGTSLRSSTLQYLHVSEFGKICARFPEKAREIISGSLNTVHAGQHIVIESTAEGREGHFFTMCEESQKNPPKSNLDFKFFFFPWHKHSEYTQVVHCDISSDLKDYFNKLALDGISLTDQQKWWYANKYKTQKDDMQREFPSKPDEAFAASQDGYWYASYLKEAYDAGRVTNIAYDRAVPIHTAWDLGQSDSMAIWFFQINRSDDINIIDYWEKNNTPLDQISIMLKSKGYNYGTHIWPHDANARDRGGVTFVQQARHLGISGVVLEPHSLLHGINLVKTTLSKCWFDKTKCAEGLKKLENYKKKWSTSFGGWTAEPVHDSASHGSDAFRYLCAGLPRIIGSSGSVEKDLSIARKFWEYNG